LKQGLKNSIAKNAIIKNTISVSIVNSV